MNGEPTVERIFVAPDGGAAMREKPAVEAVAGRGVRGDRYFEDVATGTFVTWEREDDRPNGYDLTLIEQEAVAAIEREAGIDLAPGEHRRNVETRGVALNHLVDERFRIGDVVCRGDRLCEPCDYLQRRTAAGVRDALRHRGGLRADVVEGGTIRAGDPVERLD